MNLIRFKLKDRQLLPLQRIGRNLIHQTATYCHDEWLIGQPRVNVIPFSFSKCDCRKWLLTRFGFSGVFRSKWTERQLKLRLVETVFWQTGRNVFDESCYPLILQRVDQ